MYYVWCLGILRERYFAMKKNGMIDEFTQINGPDFELMDLGLL